MSEKEKNHEPNTQTEALKDDTLEIAAGGSDVVKVEIRKECLICGAPLSASGEAACNCIKLNTIECPICGSPQSEWDGFECECFKRGYTTLPLN